MLAAYDRLTEGGDVERRLRRTAERIIELGVPPEDTRGFTGDGRVASTGVASTCDRRWSPAPADAAR